MSGGPNNWGPPLWFSMHDCAAKYPEKAWPVHSKQMKELILGIPDMLPCVVCKAHANFYINMSNESGELDIICEGKETLFNWFVDFHNAVNVRYDKKIMSYEEARELYKY